MGALNDKIAGIVTKVFDNTLVSGLELTSSVTINRIASTVYSTADGDVTGNAENYIVNAIKRKITTNDIKQLREIGITVTTDDVILSIGQDQTDAPTAILKNDEFVFDGGTYNLLLLETKNLGATGLTWICTVSRR